MKILASIQKITEIGMSTKDKQRGINVSEVFHLWNHLVTRYNVIQLTDNLGNFTSDKDLTLIINMGRKTLKEQVKMLEKEMLSYGIPLPLRPPKQTNETSNVEIINR